LSKQRKQCVENYGRVQTQWFFHCSINRRLEQI